MRLFIRIFGHRAILRRSTDYQQGCTIGEMYYIRSTARCPDCGGRLLKGPMGGDTMNTCCNRCFSEFNIYDSPRFFDVTRNSRPGPREIGDRAWCYGIQSCSADSASKKTSH